jgi:hypothetical protein
MDSYRSHQANAARFSFGDLQTHFGIKELLRTRSTWLLSEAATFQIGQTLRIAASLAFIKCHLHNSRPAWPRRLRRTTLPMRLPRLCKTQRPSAIRLGVEVNVERPTQTLRPTHRRNFVGHVAFLSQLRHRTLPSRRKNADSLKCETCQERHSAWQVCLNNEDSGSNHRSRVETYET